MWFIHLFRFKQKLSILVGSNRFGCSCVRYRYKVYFKVEAFIYILRLKCFCVNSQLRYLLLNFTFSIGKLVLIFGIPRGTLSRWIKLKRTTTLFCIAFYLSSYYCNLIIVDTCFYYEHRRLTTTQCHQRSHFFVNKFHVNVFDPYLDFCVQRFSI